ncbi:stage II sporulation protein M [Microlunatus sp. GCM10028923]|uniref:stage II sporulation protein M n=1 Tax=Microlunatus sp. GCM10028923 TaxID=3273400 RepID=UPI0036060389
MDLDSYIVRHSPQWDRLTELTERPGRLTGAEADELVELYQRVSTHLSVVRSTASDAVLEARLSALVARARAVVTGTTTPLWRSVGRFFTTVFPAAVYRARWWWGITAVINLIIATVVAWRVINVPGLGESLLDDEQVKQLVEYDFAQYYYENPAFDFFLHVWVNNARVSASCLLLGILIVPVLILLWQNIFNVGAIAGYMIDAGRSDIFWGLLLPHGMLELTVIFVAAGAGLRLGWCWIAPGRRSRAQALAEEGRAAGAIALGLALCLLISGLLEGFITPSTLPPWARLAIGGLALAGFLTYVFTLGRWAANAGETGDVGGEELIAEVPAEVP